MMVSILEPQSTVLLVIDLQERFRGAIAGLDGVVARSARLIRAFRILGLPVVVTEQYPKGLGRTLAPILEALARGGAFVPGSGPLGASDGASGAASGDAPLEKPLEKTSFSACGGAGFTATLRSLGARRIVVCGIEAHVCVHQTVLDLLGSGYEVHVAVDAVDSRNSLDRDVALRKMERSGAVPTTTEAVAFELLRDAKHPRFKEVQALFK